MFSTLLIVLFALMLAQVFRTGLIPVNWGVDQSKGLSVLVVVLLVLAFTIGFIDI